MIGTEHIIAKNKMEEKITAWVAIDINGNLSLIPDSRAPLRKTKIERLPRFQPYERFFLFLDDRLFRKSNGKIKNQLK